VNGSDGNRNDLFVASCSVTTTRRRKFLWAAWWTAPPVRLPFRKPDAFGGGARSHDEAVAQARRAAGVPLAELPPRWARAWARVLLGQAPWVVRARGTAETSGAPPTRTPTAGPSIWKTLGLSSTATADELKRAYRARALATHPDRGGDPEAFRAVQSAFEEARHRLARKRPARKRAR
jgi:DnaJ domain